MRPADRWVWLGGAALLLLLLAVATQSILRRSENYSFYPEYSTLNNETGGTKAYYEALARLHYTVERNYNPIHRLERTRAAVFYIGPSLHNFQFLNEKNMELFERIASSGTRLMIALDSKYVQFDTLAEAPAAKKKNPKKPENEEEETAPKNTLRERWGVSIKQTKQEPLQGAGGTLTGAKKSAWVFSSWTSDWKPQYMEGSVPLLLTRSFGQGEIVLMSNADLLTNAQLLRGPETSVLAALPGGFSHVIFDESHLGVADSGSVASLARAHQLQWLVFAFLLVAALYVWRSSVSFVPPLETSREFVVPGRDAHSTLESLLQRSISKRQLWGVLIREWNRSLPLLKRGFPLEETDIVANSRSNEAVAETYKRLGEKANGYSVWRK